MTPHQTLDAARGSGPAYFERFATDGCAREAADQLAAAGREPRYPIEFRSQFGEDALIWRLFAGQSSGFFIEAGAFDGYTFSATYALECVGWSGLLVEAIPEQADACRARRRHSRVVHAALGASDGGETAFTIAEDEQRGMLSYVAGLTPHKKSTARAPSRTVVVPMTTMNSLLADHAGEIDVAVIDVEGSELSLLAGFDLRRFRPKVLIVEDNSRGSDTALPEVMADMPYEQVAWLKVNRVYVRADLASAWAARLTTGARRPTASAPQAPPEAGRG